MMKKYILFVLCFFCSLVLYAQSGHLSFMDIPIDGTISEFQAKLKGKGIRHDVKGSAELPVGRRMFKGIVEGKKVILLCLIQRPLKLFIM